MCWPENAENGQCFHLHSLYSWNLSSMIQTHDKRTKHNMHIFSVISVMKLENDTLTIKWWKVSRRRNPVICFWLSCFRGLEECSSKISKKIFRTLAAILVSDLFSFYPVSVFIQRYLWVWAPWGKVGTKSRKRLASDLFSCCILWLTTPASVVTSLYWYRLMGTEWQHSCLCFFCVCDLYF